MDSQQLEIIGRQVLVKSVIEADLEVAMPLRDRGVDLLVYRDIDEQAGAFRALPVQLKAASSASFEIDAKYARISDLLIVYVWHLADGKESVIYGLTYGESLKVAEAMGWTRTASWGQGKYTTTRPSKRLVEMLEGYRMGVGAWRRRVVGV
jgi:hypothetical protein